MSGAIEQGLEVLLSGMEEAETGFGGVLGMRDADMDVGLLEPFLVRGVQADRGLSDQPCLSRASAGRKRGRARNRRVTDLLDCEFFICLELSGVSERKEGREKEKERRTWISSAFS